MLKDCGLAHEADAIDRSRDTLHGTICQSENLKLTVKDCGTTSKTILLEIPEKELTYLEKLYALLERAPDKELEDQTRAMIEKEEKRLEEERCRQSQKCGLCGKHILM